MNNTNKDIVLISHEIYLGSSVILVAKNKSSDDTYLLHGAESFLSS